MYSGAAKFQAARTALAAALAVLLLGASGVTERSDRWWFDTLQAFGAARAPVPADTALVLIDEQSLTVLGEAPFGMRWPWPRTAFAALLAGLRAAGAERVAVDLVFFEQSAAAEQDAVLGAVAAGLPGVVLATVPERVPVVWPEALRQGHPQLFAGPARWGVVRSQPDADAVIRAYEPRGSLAAATRAADPGGGELPAAPAPAGEVFERVRGKTVFVGANAAATFDAIATPLGAPEPGVLVHWTAYANLAAGDFIRPLPQALGWAVALLVIVVMVLAGRTAAGLRQPTLVAVLAGALLAAGSAGLFLAGAWFAPALPVAAASLAFTAVATERFRVERARKQEIQGWFGAYVSPGVVRRLVADPHAIELGGEQRELTILFSDIAGFTTISERLPPAQLVTLINRFLEGQTERILDHGGYLDKYIGDAIMAVFGAPEPLDNHALAACRATLACRAALAELNDEIEREHGLRLGMRTGINTGEAVVGNVGSARKRNYTVLGDAVNLASRLEGANKETGTSILLGPLTAARVGAAMVLRPVARLQVKGKTQAVEVFELLGEREGAADATIAFAAAFTRGFEAYCGRRFEQAAADFAGAAALRPGDLPSEHYLAEARRFMADPPGPEWHGILKLETK